MKLWMWYERFTTRVNNFVLDRYRLSQVAGMNWCTCRAGTGFTLNGGQPRHIKCRDSAYALRWRRNLVFFIEQCSRRARILVNLWPSSVARWCWPVSRIPDRSPLYTSRWNMYTGANIETYKFTTIELFAGECSFDNDKYCSIAVF